MILAPTSSFVPIQDAAFEHRMYLSLATVVAGVVIGMWLAGQWLVASRGDPGVRVADVGRRLGACSPAAALAFSPCNAMRITSDDVTIWQDTVAKAPGNERAHANLGLGLVGRGLGRRGHRRISESARNQARLRGRS